jgi:hypothetical protein
MQPPLRLGDLTGNLRIDPALCIRWSAASDFCAAPPQNQRTSNAFTVR